MTRSIPAQRIDEIRPFRVMEVLAQARALEAAGHDIVHMEIGEPDFPTAEPILRAGQKALADGHTHYTDAPGLWALREAIAGYYQRHRGVTVAPERIVITTGASGALLLALGLTLNAGDELLLTDPGYPCYRNFAAYIQARCRFLAVDENSGWQVSRMAVREAASEHARALLLASPANPTGAVMLKGDLQALAHEMAAHQGWLICDEIYHGLRYAGPVASALDAGDNVLVVDSFSKYFGMTGWRVGWLVVPPELVEAAGRLQQNLAICAPVPSQHAALAALGEEAMTIHEQRREACRHRRDLLLPALRELGFSIPLAPAGAFYLYAGCNALAASSEQLAHDLLEHAGVAITPGSDFGEYRSHAHVRFACTTGEAALQQGLERIRNFLRAGA